MLSSRLFRKINCSCPNKKVSNWHLKGQKTKKFQIFQVFMQFLSKFRRTPWIGMLKTFIKVRLCCPVVFYEQIIAVFRMKTVSNLHQRSQKTQTFKIFKVFKQFLSKLRQTPWIRILNTYINVRIRCPVVFMKR